MCHEFANLPVLCQVRLQVDAVSPVGFGRFFVQGQLSAGLLTSRPSSLILKSMTNRWIRAAISVLFSFGIALFVDIYRQSQHWTILDHSFQFGLTFFGIWAVTAGILILSWSFLARWEVKRTEVDPAEVHRRGILAALPLGFFLLSHWLLVFTRPEPTCG
jgi:hypothetical protein